MQSKQEQLDSPLDATCSNVTTQALIVKALSAIVHKGATVEQAQKILGEKP